MAYKKIVSGVANQSNETNSNNKIILGHPGFGFAALYIVIFVSIWITGSIVYMLVFHANVVTGLITWSFIGLFVTAWIYTIQWLRRENSNTRTLITVNDATQEKASLESRILAMTEQYILYKDHNNEIQFRGTVTVTENRHYPALEAPKSEQNAQDAILTMWDGGSSARSIEKHLNMGKTGTDKISYHQIMKTLNLYRQGWNTVHKKVIDAEPEDSFDE